jgi:HEAT repeat protein
MVSVNRGKFEIEKSHLGPYSRVLRRLQAIEELLPDSPGLDNQILEALESTDPDIHYEAVVAAGRQELDAAWPHVVALVEDRSTPKPLLLAAIEAVGQIRPREAGVVLIELYDSTNDKEIAEAADEAMQMAQAMTSEGEDDDDEDASEWVN